MRTRRSASVTAAKRVFHVQVGPGKQTVTVRVPASATEREVELAIARAVADWRQIAAGRQELGVGPGHSLDDIEAAITNAKGHTQHQGKGRHSCSE